MKQRTVTMSTEVRILFPFSSYSVYFKFKDPVCFDHLVGEYREDFSKIILLSVINLRQEQRLSTIERGRGNLFIYLYRINI